jgi:hypothetical protein
VLGNLGRPPLCFGQARWNAAALKNGGQRVTNIRNTSSSHWRGWLKPDRAIEEIPGRRVKVRKS